METNWNKTKIKNHCKKYSDSAYESLMFSFSYSRTRYRQLTEGLTLASWNLKPDLTLSKTWKIFLCWWKKDVTAAITWITVIVSIFTGLLDYEKGPFCLCVALCHCQPLLQFGLIQPPSYLSSIKSLKGQTVDVMCEPPTFMTKPIYFNWYVFSNMVPEKVQNKRSVYPSQLLFSGLQTIKMIQIKANL